MNGTLADVVRVKQRFARSANVERDAEGSSVDGYIPTARALDVLARVVDGILQPSVGRAISITGPYGSGKSSLALFLSALFGNQSERARASAETILHTVDPALAARVAVAREALGAASGGFVRAVIAAQQEPISATVLRALRVGVHRYAGNEATTRATPAFDRVLNADPLAIKTAADVRDLVREVSQVAPVLLVLDEFGKNLEFFARSPAGTEDLYVMQDLAEWASGETPLPLVMVTLQHLAFEDYVSGASVAQRREWSKVLGRFADVPYIETVAQAKALIASVFEAAGGAAERERVRDWARAACAAVDACGLGGVLPADRAACYPLHPVTLAVLPDLCARYGQNERTLFSFLAGAEALSVRSYLAETPLPECGPLPSVGLERVYDYFLESASTMVGAAATASRWLEIETRIRDAQGLSDAERRVLKTIGVLNLVSAGGELRASKRVLAFACADDGGLPERREEIDSVITALEAKGLITYRAFADEFRIWSGTDFDLKGAVELARRRLRDEPVAVLLERTRPLTPVVAARHSQVTGTLRVFERRYVDRRSPKIAPLPAPSPADGLVLLCIDPAGQLPELSTLADADKPIVVGRSSGASEITKAARDLAAHLDVLNTAADVESDWVARRELRERAALAAMALDSAFERAFGPASRAVRWERLPDLTPLPAAGSLSAVLSALCDERYPATPKIRNEMLARRDLTSQGARARRELLEAMVERSDQNRLGLQGFGPERAMYDAVLLSPAIHRPLGGGMWGFHAPSRRDTLNFQPAWLAIEAMFDEAAGRQVSVDEILERMMAPPVGLKEGPIPVLVTAALLARADDVALYEQGTFVTRLTADVIERLAKNPHRFTVKGYATRGERGRVLVALAEALGVSPRQGARTRVASVVRIASPLLAKARGLTAYAQRTRQLSAAARGVRTTLFEAREPDELIFVSLPQALGLDPFPPSETITDERIGTYVQSLTEAIVEIEGTYQRLLDHIEHSLATALGVEPARLRHDARVRAGRLVGQILEPQLRSFALALTDEHLDRDEWLPYVGMLLASKPVASWTDEDRARFEQRCIQVGSAFRRVESLHFSQAAVPSEGFEAVRITLTLSDGTDVPQVVWIDDSARDLLGKVADQALARISRNLGEQGREMLLAAVARRVLAPRQQSELSVRHSEDIGRGQRHG